MKDLLKLGLIGGAALFLLKDQVSALFATASSSTPGPSATPPPTSGAPANTPQTPSGPAVAPPSTQPSPLIVTQPSTPPGTVTPLPDASGPLPLTEQSYMQAAANPMVSYRLPQTVRFNGDQWNWYRNAYLRSQGLPEQDFGAPESFLPPGAPRDTLMNAMQYHSFRQQAGLGIIRQAVWGRSGAWS